MNTGMSMQSFDRHSPKDRRINDLKRTDTVIADASESTSIYT